MSSVSGTPVPRPLPAHPNTHKSLTSQAHSAATVTNASSIDRAWGVPFSILVILAKSTLRAMICACAALTSVIDVDSSASLVSVDQAPGRPIVTVSGFYAIELGVRDAFADECHAAGQRELRCDGQIAVGRDGRDTRRARHSDRGACRPFGPYTLAVPISVVASAARVSTTVSAS